MKIKCIHHVAIICSDYEKSKHFYIDILGFKPINEIYRKDRDSFKLDLEIGGKYQIELFSFVNPPRRLSYPEACGLRHLALGVDNIDDFVTYLKSNGLDIEDGIIRMDDITSRRFAFLHDPDGLPIEIYEEQ
jgi:glyoxylase I family protein